MKKNLKIISLLSLFVIATTTFFIFAKRPADDKPETVMVKSYLESIETYYGNDKMEELKCRKSELNEKLIDLIQNLNKQGYKIVSQSQFPVSNVSAYGTTMLTLK